MQSHLWMFPWATSLLMASSCNSPLCPCNFLLGAFLDPHKHKKSPFSDFSTSIYSPLLGDHLWQNPSCLLFTLLGKTRDLFKKTRNTKGTFHAKTSTIKDKNYMDLTEAEDINKRWQEYTEELYKKNLHDPDNHDGVITHLEPDILE